MSSPDLIKRINRSFPPRMKLSIRASLDKFLAGRTADELAEVERVIERGLGLSFLAARLHDIRGTLKHTARETWKLSSPTLEFLGIPSTSIATLRAASHKTEHLLSKRGAPAWQGAFERRLGALRMPQRVRRVLVTEMKARGKALCAKSRAR